jgi:hypothetical protein
MIRTNKDVIQYDPIASDIIADGINYNADWAYGNDVGYPPDLY